MAFLGACVPPDTTLLLVHVPSDSSCAAQQHRTGGAGATGPGDQLDERASEANTSTSFLLRNLSEIQNTLLPILIIFNFTNHRL